MPILLWSLHRPYLLLGQQRFWLCQYPCRTSTSWSRYHGLAFQLRCYGWMGQLAA